MTPLTPWKDRGQIKPIPDWKLKAKTIARTFKLDSLQRRSGVNP
jgi:hypothetical protein